MTDPAPSHQVNGKVDSPDVAKMAALDDLAAISQATPPVGPLAQPIAWRAPAGERDLVAYVELSQESDFNAFHDHPCMADDEPAWDFWGHAFLGQPSIVYAVPFRLGAPNAFTTSTYVGYGSWDGSTGEVHAPDTTITDRPGTGAGRLLDQSDADGSYRVKVRVSGCP